MPAPKTRSEMTPIGRTDGRTNQAKQPLKDGLHAEEWCLIGIITLDGEIQRRSHKTLFGKYLEFVSAKLQSSK